MFLTVVGVQNLYSVLHLLPRKSAVKLQIASKIIMKLLKCTEGWKVIASLVLWSDTVIISAVVAWIQFSCSRGVSPKYTVSLNRKQKRVFFAVGDFLGLQAFEWSLNARDWIALKVCSSIFNAVLLETEPLGRSHHMTMYVWDRISIALCYGKMKSDCFEGQL